MCPFTPCINPLARPIPQLGSIDVFESEASRVYHGATISIRRQMTHGLYFQMAYTYAHAIDDGPQDPLVAGRPATVQNSYSPSWERGNSVTDQHRRFVFSWIYEPRALHNGQGWLDKLTKGVDKNSGVITAGSGRPVNATVIGDANRGRQYQQRPHSRGAQKFVRRTRLHDDRHAGRADNISPEQSKA